MSLTLQVRKMKDRLGGNIMKKEVILILVISVFMTISGLSGSAYATDGGVKSDTIIVSEKKYGADKTAEEVKGAEALKPENSKMAEEARRAVEEAKKIIVAKVNGQDINMFMLVRTMNKVAPKYVKEGEITSPEITEKIRTEALDRLILEELAVQEAIKQNINPNPTEIEEVIAQVKKNLATEEAYREYLVNSNLTEETLEKLIERSRRYELITAREVYGKVRVDEKLLKAEYEKEKGRFILPDSFLVEDVLFIKGENEEAIREKADKVLKTIRKKNNDVWNLILDGTFIVRKTAIKQERHPEIYKAMLDLNVGDLSGVITDLDGFHIIKVIKKDFSRQASFEEAKAALESKFLVSAQEERKKEWEEELRKDAKIEILSLNDLAKRNEKDQKR
jgi:parvulin-like peptidyl-prolyl isomerase